MKTVLINAWLMLVVSSSMMYAYVGGAPELVLPGRGDVVYPAGARLMVPCTLPSGTGQGVTLTWRDNQGSIVGTSGRISVRYQDINDGSLIVSFDPIENEDAGLYTCSATNYDTGVIESENFYLNIYQPIAFDYAPTRQEFSEGEDALVRCEVSGQPVPEVSWRHRGQLIETGSKYMQHQNGLLIHHFSCRDEGVYKCRAEVSSMGAYSDKEINVILSDEQ